MIAFRNFVTRIATTGQKGLDLAIRLGKQGEETAQTIMGFAKNTQPYFTSAGNYRIFDGVIGKNFIEVKDVATQSLTAQLRDMIEIATINNGTFTLIVRAGTQLTQPLQKLVDNGTVELLRLL